MARLAWERWFTFAPPERSRPVRVAAATCAVIGLATAIMMVATEAGVAHRIAGLLFVGASIASWGIALTAPPARVDERGATAADRRAAAAKWPSKSPDDYR